MNMFDYFPHIVFLKIGIFKLLAAIYIFNKTGKNRRGGEHTCWKKNY